MSVLRIIMRWYYQMRIDAAEDDMYAMRKQPAMIAAQIKLHERSIANWRRNLAQAQD